MALKPLNSVAGFSVGETPNIVIYSNTDISTNNFSALGISNLNNVSNVIILGGSNGQVLRTDGLGNLSFTTIDTWQIQNGNSNVQVLANSNVTISVTGNANIATFTSTGANISGYLTVDGTITANGNLSANNYLVTPATKDLIVAPATSLIRSYANINPYNDLAYDLGNGLARWGNIYANNSNLTGNLTVTDTANVGNLRTNNLLYANGVPWDLQEAAGANYEIQYNIDDNFAASANFTYNDTTQLLTVLGNAQFNNANLGNLATANYVNVANQINGNIANFSGNLTALNANLGNLATANYVNVANEVNGNVANFSGNLTALNANLGNLATANFANISSNLAVTDTASVGNLRTDNLLYANGLPWDLQEAAGSNTQIQYNDGLNNFGASANFTYDDATQLFKVTGNANITNVAVLGNLSVTNNVLTSLVPNANVTYDLGNATNQWNNVYAQNFVGNISGNISAPGSNTQIIFNDANVANAVANFTYDKTYNSNGGRLNVGNTVGGEIITDSFYANYANAGNLDVINTITGFDIESSNSITITGAGGVLTLTGGNIVGVDDISANTANFTSNVTVNNLTVNLELAGNTANFSGDVIVPNLTVNTELSGNTANFSGNVVVPNLTVNTELSGNTANFSGNVIVPNLTVNTELSGNTANFSGNVIVPNLTVNLELAGNTANFTGNITAANANLGNLATANYINVAFNLVATGNITGANLVGPLANGNSNVLVYSNSNVEISVNGVSNIASFSGNSLFVVGNIESTLGNVLANGNVTANGTLNGANANVTGEGKFGSVVTSNITAPTGNITISAVGVDQNIILAPTGNGVVDVSGKRIIDLADPVDPTDAVTKEYVDSIAQGLTIHAPVRVESNVALNGTYTQGGTTQTTTDITGNKTIQFSSNHGLSVDDGIVWTNSFNGIVGGQGYWVYSVPALNQITVSDTYHGPEVTTLTNGTGLTQASRANPGVGATLVNAGANAALVIDSVAVANGDRVLVYSQTSTFENGVYDVTDKGNSTAQWVLTRSSDMDTYIPQSTLGMGYGDYFFIQEGATAAGESYVLTAPQGSIIIGTDGLTFTQFAAAGTYTAGNGINITGTVISANVDNDTTAIVSGNIVVKSSANLTTPNIGDATFSSLSWNTLSNGNVTANNLSIGNIANITLDLTVGGNIQANGTISSNANVSGLNLTTSGNVQAGGNVLANNISANTNITAGNVSVNNATTTNSLTVNNAITGNTANFSGNVIVNNLTTNLEFAGNTANFSGNVILPNLTVNTELSGNTANFTGNIVALNANLGNLATANFFTGTLANGTSNIAILNNGNINLTANANTSLVVTDTGANVTGDLGVSGNFNVGSIVATNLTANTSVFVGNTVITWANVTTTSTSANQTISSYTLTGTDIAGIQWLVKAVDSTGSKYSVATVQAVTDGTSVDYAVYGTVQLNGYTGSLAVNIVGSTIRLQVTPASSNSTVWTTQYRMI